MKRITLIAVLGLLVVTTIMSCNSPTQKVENAKDNVEEAKGDLEKANLKYLEEIENFRKEISERMLANEKKIAQLKVLVAQEKLNTRVLFEKKLAELEKKNRDMQKKLNEFKEDGKDEWASFKTEFNHDMNALGKALNDFFTDNKK